MSMSRRRRGFTLMLIAAMARVGLAAVPNQPSVVTVQGTQLIVRKRLMNGTLSQPVAYSIKGVDWSPATRSPDTGPLPTNSPLGASNQYGFFFDWAGRNPQGHILLNYWLTNEHQAHYQQDIPLMAQMHVNTVRLYGDFGDDPSVYGPILDTFYNNGIMVVMTLPGSKADIDSGRYVQVMSYCKNHPAILMWSIGNEWNFNLMYGYANLAAAETGINALVPLMKTLDPNHPVSSSLGDAGSAAGFAAITGAVPNVDLWALNIYRGATFGTLFTQWTTATSKPFYFSEFGIDSFNTSPTGYTLIGNGEAHVTAGNEDQPTQSLWDLSLWNDIQPNLSGLNNTKSCLGGFVFSWNDALWKVGDFNTGLGNLPSANYANNTGNYATQQPDGFYIPGGFPDNVDNEEYFGIVNADRVPKQAYNDLQTYYSTLAPLPLASIVISPSSATIHYNQSVTFTAQALHAFEEVLLSTPTYTWSVSPSAGVSISSSGVFTSFVTSGTFVVSAVSGVIVSSVQVMVVNAPPTVATSASALPNLVVASSSTLSVLGADDRTEANLSYIWSSTGPAPVVFLNPQSLNSSKSMGVTFSSAGLYAFTVTLKDLDGATTTNQVNVMVSQTLTTLALQPPLTTVIGLSTHSFTTIQTDQFGRAMNPPVAVLWTAAAGSINSSGLFTAGIYPGPVVVTADSGLGLTASSFVTVTHSSPTIAQLPMAAPNPATATQTTLTILGADDEGESTIRYTWALASGPAPVQVATPQNTNAAKTSVVTFSSTGTYQFSVMLQDLAQFQTTGQITVTVLPTLLSLTLSPGAVTLSSGTIQAFSATGTDQFGHGMSLGSGGQWSASGGVISSSGIYVAGPNAGTFSVSYSSGLVTGSAAITITVLSPPAAFPAPTFNFSGTVPVDGELAVSLPAGFISTGFNWTLTPSIPGAQLSDAAKGYAPAGNTYPTTTGVLKLGPLNIPPGYYLVTVQAFGQNGTASPVAQGFVTLVPIDFTAFRVYPSPWRSDLHSSLPITFDGLPGNTTVKIFTLSGRWVQTLGPANNIITWDLKNDSGDRVASGLYFYLISNDQGQKGRGKFAIIR